ncbi:MAG: hybrid sensor histidine kinase/response regulator [bacterium]|nr:hybrid sensor histidine kinase/response regulator [bacterium]
MFSLSSLMTASVLIFSFLAIGAMVAGARSRELLLRRRMAGIMALLGDVRGEEDSSRDYGKSDICSALAAVHTALMLRLDKGSEFPLAAEGAMQAQEDLGVDGIIDNSLRFLLQRCRDELRAAAVLVQHESSSEFVVRELLGWSPDCPSALEPVKSGPRIKALLEKLIGSLRTDENDIRVGHWIEVAQIADGSGYRQSRLDVVCALAGFGFGSGYMLPFEMSTGARGMLWCCGYSGNQVGGKSRRLIFAVVSYLAAQLAPSLRMSQALSRQSRENEFLVGASHDLRSPLSYALAELREMLGSGEGIALRQREIIFDVIDCLEGQGEVISNVLDVARDHAGLLKAHPGYFSLTGVLEPVIRRFSRLAERKGLSYAVVAEQELLVRFDRQHLQRIVGNLLSNALKYTSHGGITVFFELDLQSSSVCRVRVSDTGCGLGVEEAQRVFEKFYRSGKVGEAPGTGYGLSISRVLAEMNVGRIFYQANSEGGSDFVLELPLLEQGKIAEVSSEDNVASHCLLSSPAPEKVLIIDDESAICRLNSRYLSADHFQIVTAESFDSAREQLCRQKPDIVISDINIAGHSLFDWVRREPELWQDQPIVVVSGASSELDSIPDELKGARFLVKPAQREDLRSAVAELLARKVGVAAENSGRSQ